MTAITKTVYLMRGLPACEKSHRATRLAGNDGRVFETDEYFYTQVGDDSSRHDLTVEDILDGDRP
ncbi:MAG: hypothetical protein HQ518_24265 [Rhodopirellula sp.]|nr:hypothetical protein [Rhodopirellula sp.]